MEIPSFAVMRRCFAALHHGFSFTALCMAPVRTNRRHARAPPAEPAAPVLRQSGPGFRRRHVLTRGHLRCPLSAPFSPRPSSPDLRSSRFHTVAASCGATGAPVPADAGDCFPGPLRYGAAFNRGHTAPCRGLRYSACLFLSRQTRSSRFFRAAVTLRAVASLSCLPLRLTFVSYFRQPSRRRRLALLGSGSILSLSL